MIVYEDGKIEGTVGGGKLEMLTITDALATISTAKPIKRIYDLAKDLDMSCGGVTEMYIEPILPDLKLYIFGSGHVGQAVARYAPDFDFQVTLFDSREIPLHSMPNVNLYYIGKDYLDSIENLTFDSNTFIMIATHTHASDEKLLSICARKQSAYLGMIGSKTKISQARKRLTEQKILTEKELNRVDMPIGISFNAISPQEIALSILAKMIDVKNTMTT
jgi:xanthine dehydrogenase accessory factor